MKAFVMQVFNILGREGEFNQELHNGRLLSDFHSLRKPKTIARQSIDGYDLFLLETMRQKAVSQIITDDGDYVTVLGIQVFTANQNVITAARNQGKLVTR